jgi:aldose 1-epimerase
MAAGNVRRGDMLTISDGIAEAGIVPELGAGLAWYDFHIMGRREPLFRPCRDPSRAHPFDLALNLLVPWSNRISRGGFTFASEFHPLTPNLPGEPFPIHGNGFSSVWQVETVEATRTMLVLESIGPGPFHYVAGVVYQLQGGDLAVRLWVRNKGAKPLPFGLGLHPWLPRTSGTQLQAKCERVVLENSDHLPAGELAVGARDDLNFNISRKLPNAFINNAFLGWDGRAQIVWKDRDVSLTVQAELPIATYIVYSPDAAADFFCFEPVTHPVDAHNGSGGAQANGLIILNAQQEMAIDCRFSPRVIG